MPLLAAIRISSWFACECSWHKCRPCFFTSALDAFSIACWVISTSAIPDEAACLTNLRSASFTAVAGAVAAERSAGAAEPGATGAGASGAAVFGCGGLFCRSQAVSAPARNMATVSAGIYSDFAMAIASRGRQCCSGALHVPDGALLLRRRSLARDRNSATGRAVDMLVDPNKRGEWAGRRRTSGHWHQQGVASARRRGRGAAVLEPARERCSRQIPTRGLSRWTTVADKGTSNPTGREVALLLTVV